jgi:hypothetical protein
MTITSAAATLPTSIDITPAKIFAPSGLNSTTVDGAYEDFALGPVPQAMAARMAISKQVSSLVHHTIV